MSRDEAATAAQESRVQNLEIKLAYVEQLLDDLNQVVTAQQDRIDMLLRRLELIQRKLDAEAEDESSAPPFV